MTAIILPLVLLSVIIVCLLLAYRVYFEMADLFSINHREFRERLRNFHTAHLMDRAGSVLRFQRIKYGFIFVTLLAVIIASVTGLYFLYTH